MAKETDVQVGDGTPQNPFRTIDFGELTFTINKYREADIDYVLYKISYAGKYLYIKGKCLAGSLILFVDTLNSFNPDSSRFKSHFYTHMYKHILATPGGRFRLKIIDSVGADCGFYDLLKQEQMALDAARYDDKCLNNQMDAYIPNYSEKTGMYGWIPKTAVMNFNRWLSSAERKDHAAQYKK